MATSASYQATFAGFAKRGIERKQAAALMQLSVQLAMDARDEFWDDLANRQGRLKPLVAASIGPYGAYLTGGAEYSGDYGLTLQQLMDFHAPRLEVLAASGADVLACETIPSLLETEALVRLLEENVQLAAWVSCSCGDGLRLWHGESLSEVVELVNQCNTVVATGVNCTAPHWVESLLLSVADLSTKPLLAYPNRGEQWDGVNMCWVEGSGVETFDSLVPRWYAAGARLIGGCCRTTPADISAIATSITR